jgi:hypothetical protein
VPDLVLEDPREANLYSFSRNNPVRYLDPDGRCVTCIQEAMERAGPGGNAQEFAEQMWEMEPVFGIEVTPQMEANVEAFAGATMPLLNTLAAIDSAGGLGEWLSQPMTVEQMASGGKGTGPTIGLGKGKANDRGGGGSGGTGSASALEKAQAALGDELSSLAKRPNRKLPATSVGAFNPKTGRAAADSSFKGCCAEVGAAAKVGGKPRDVVFTKPVRPRTGQIVPVCKDCQGKFDRNQFPDGTPFAK